MIYGIVLGSCKGDIDVDIDTDAEVEIDIEVIQAIRA